MRLAPPLVSICLPLVDSNRPSETLDGQAVLILHQVGRTQSKPAVEEIAFSVFDGLGEVFDRRIVFTDPEAGTPGPEVSIPVGWIESNGLSEVLDGGLVIPFLEVRLAPFTMGISQLGRFDNQPGEIGDCGVIIAVSKCTLPRSLCTTTVNSSGATSIKASCWLIRVALFRSVMAES